MKTNEFIYNISLLTKQPYKKIDERAIKAAIENNNKKQLDNFKGGVKNETTNR